jgi:XTP/dITP diphosphohydrolase
VLAEAEGHGGFGYDPVFRPAGEHRSAAAMTAEEKNAVSHRGLAFRTLVERLGSPTT